MVNRLIGALIMIVIGLALLPVVADFVDDLTGVGGILEGETLGTLVNLLPTIYVILIVVGAVGFIAFNKRG